MIIILIIISMIIISLIIIIIILMIFIILHNHLNFTLPSDGAEVSVVREGDVIRWVPVEAGKCHYHRCYHLNHHHS